MKISYNWLKEFVEFNEKPENIARILTFQGFETTIAKSGVKWTNVVTAKVLDVKKHPNADKLTLCDVTDGSTNYSVVCGAPNVAKGQVVPFARLGAELSGFKIERRKIRGVESEGMICSEKELGISDEAKGIMVLSESVQIGKPFDEVMGVADTIFELETTTNRPDCLNHFGVARELAAHFKTKLKMPQIKSRELKSDVKISILDGELCHRYIGCKITGIKAGPSPDWIVKRLQKCGLRPINNIVDITNYVLLELGHPLHAFDLSFLKGEEIIVRRAKESEKILALDGKEYQLNDSMLVIADAEKPQAIAGVIGGEHSGVTEKTTDIILESAVFLPNNVRRTSKALNLSTDSSYRFERGTSWDMCAIASQRAVDLIESIAKGTPEHRKDEVKKSFVNASVDLRPQRANKLLGTEIKSSQMNDILTSLGMTVKEQDGKLTAEIPSWRLDITQEADLIEEVARINSYDKIPVTVPHIIPDINEDKKLVSKEEILRQRLVSLGFCEAMNYTFTNQDVMDKFKMQAAEHIANPLSCDNEAMRPNILPSLMINLELNLSHGHKSVKIFETGRVFASKAELRKLGILCYGPLGRQWWKFSDTNDVLPQADFFFVSGVVKNIFSGNKIKINTPENAPEYFHPGKCAALNVNSSNIGFFGMIHPNICLDIEGEVAYAEIDMSALTWNYKTPQFKQLMRFPPVKRDLSLLAEKSTSYNRISELFDKISSKSEIFEGYELFSIFDDEQKLGAGKISYAFHLIFHHPEHTLKDAEVNNQIEDIVTSLKKELNITLR